MVNPIVAAILSFFIPGLGQIIAGETKKGIIFLVALIIIWALVTVAGPMIGIITFLFCVYAAYDAYKIASAAE